MATFVLVHGGWVGGWFMEPLARALAERGHRVHRPTLTGLGERAHLAGHAIDLDTHITDIASVLRYEDLREVVLVGHSYGGMVVTGVADQVPERLGRVVYVDGMVPENGESVADLIGPELAGAFRALAEANGGWRLPLPFPSAAMGFTDPAVVAWFESRVVDQPLASAFGRVRRTGAGDHLPRLYVYCSRAAMGLFEQSAARARNAGWEYVDLDVTHGCVALEPDRLAEVLVAPPATPHAALPA